MTHYLTCEVKVISLEHRIKVDPKIEMMQISSKTNIKTDQESDWSGSVCEMKLN